jgi:hypothetical protein
LLLQLVVVLSAHVLLALLWQPAVTTLSRALLLNVFET